MNGNLVETYIEEFWIIAYSLYRFDQESRKFVFYFDQVVEMLFK